MAYNVVVKEEAIRDAAIAYLYYEEHQKGLGGRFLIELQERYKDLSVHPFYYSLISEDPKQVLRDVKLRRFPFVLIYEISGNDVIVYAVHNTNKHSMA